MYSESTCSWWFHDVVFLIVLSISCSHSLWEIPEAPLRLAKSVGEAAHLAEEAPDICAVEPSQVDSERPFLQCHARLKAASPFDLRLDIVAYVFAWHTFPVKTKLSNDLRKHCVLLKWHSNVTLTLTTRWHYHVINHFTGAVTPLQ